ncbi:MAG: hypothetical protein ACHQNA_05990 [Acidimicrobiales bacterium]
MKAECPQQPPVGGILYWFQVMAVPEGGAPEVIRRQWVGVPLPVRRPRPMEGPDPKIGRDVLEQDRRKLITDGVVVEFTDALDALRLFGREEAAAWWEGWLQSRRTTGALVFRVWEGRLLPTRFAGRLFPELDEFGTVPD